MQGDFKKKVGDAEHFETEVPTFANTDQLAKQLEDNDVKVNAKPPQDRSLLETILFSFGPDAADHRPAGVLPAPRLPAGGRRRHARPVRALQGPPRRGRRGHARELHRRGRHRRGQGRAVRDRRLPQAAREVPEARRPDPARRAALGPAGHRQDAAGQGGGGRGRACRSSPSRPRSSSRPSWASAPRACATCSSRPRTPRRPSSSSTSSTPSAARARAAAASPAAATTSASRR